MPSSPRGRPRHDDVLTPAEWRVAEAVRHGMTNPEIARRQQVSVEAVKYHVSNLLIKLGMSRRAQLRRWDGVQRGSNLALKDLNVNQQLALGPICQISRTVQNIEAATLWYKEVLQLKHLYSFGQLAFFDCGGLRLFLSQGSASKEDSIIYFQVDDVRTAHRLLADRGVEFLAAPHMIHKHEDGTEEWLAPFKDNEGRPLAIMAQVR
jgi:DNA-binding CsgD family transcriptional regulator